MNKKKTVGMFIPPRADVAFKELMRLEDVRKHFISDVLENAGVMRAVNEVRLVNLNRWLKARYEARQRDQRDRWALEDAIKEDGYNEGMAQGISIGEVQGITIGEARGDLYRSRQMILDLLEDLGEIPKDIRDCICTEESIELLRRWHKVAARAKDFNDFRLQIEKDIL